MLYSKRNQEKISYITDFMRKEYLIYHNNDNILELKFNKTTIISIEAIIRNNVFCKQQFNYEKLRSEYIPNCKGPSIEGELKNSIKEKLKSLGIKNDIEFLYYSSIPFTQFLDFFFDDDIFFIFKMSEKIYLYNKNKYFSIDIKKNCLNEYQDKNMLDFTFLKKLNKNKNNKNFAFIDSECALEDIPDLAKGNSNIFLYKIYELGTRSHYKYSKYSKSEYY